MKKKLFLIAWLFPLLAAHAFETGPADSVQRIPAAGGRGVYGAVDISKAAAVTGALSPANGGTGVVNNAAATLTRSGNHAVTLTTTNTTGVTLPTAGTLSTLAGTETLSNKTFSDAPTLTQISTPSNPSAGLNKVYPKSDGTFYYLSSAGVETQLTPQTEMRRNFWLNGGMDFWQAIEGTATTIANTVSTYGADQWYVKNSLGTNGVITISRQTAVADGSKYGFKVLITTAPTAAQANGTELYQVLENQDSLQLYNQTVSASAKIKAFGNVNQMGLQFCYKTTEAKCDTMVGSEQTCTVSTGGNTLCSLTGQALGTSMTTSGVIGLRIRITGVSSGNTYDLNNGYQVEQVMGNLGALPATFQRQFRAYSAELLTLQRFFFKTFDQGTAPATGVTAAIFYRTNGSFNHSVNVRFPVPMRIAPTMTSYNPVSANNKWRNLTASVDNSAPSYNTSTTNSEVIDATGSATTGQGVGINITADSRI